MDCGFLSLLWPLSLLSSVVFLYFVEQDWVHYGLLRQIESLPPMPVFVVPVLIILGSVLRIVLEHDLMSTSNNCISSLTINPLTFDILPIKIAI